MKISAKWLLAIFLIASAIFFHLFTMSSTPVSAPIVLVPVPAAVIPPGIIVAESASGGPVYALSSLSGESLLRGYASENSSPQQDLIQLSRALSNFLLTHKQAADRPLSANEEWSAMLLGQRPGSEPWISAPSPLLDEKKCLIDRWQRPLHFHALGRSQWEIRSSGPDKILFTDDDLTSTIR